MCRFLTYFSNESILLENLLDKPTNSLIKQSHETKEGTHGVNADGFGIAWYDFDINSHPGVFKSIQPAWNDNNLIHLSQKIRSPCFLAHVRASTIGDVNQNNCHPFAYENYAFAHNGTIRSFDQYKKRLIETIDEDLFLNIRGNTDSEFFFFLIMHFMRREKNLEISVLKAIYWVIDAQKNDESFSRINIAITNGQELIGTRFATKGYESLSLKYHTKLTENNEITSLILSSEALDENELKWHDFPDNHYLHINKSDMVLTFKEII